jgi:hypothetical protein
VDEEAALFVFDDISDLAVGLPESDRDAPLIFEISP